MAARIAPNDALIQLRQLVNDPNLDDTSGKILLSMSDGNVDLAAMFYQEQKQAEALVPAAFYPDARPSTAPSKGGQCVECSIKTHYKNERITNAQIYQGVCIQCFPQLVPQATRGAFFLQSLHKWQSSGFGRAESVDRIKQCFHSTGPTSLVLAGFNLVSLPTSLGGLLNLVFLDCSKNRLEALPPCFGSLHSLEELRCNSNRLRFLPESIGRLPNLKVLHCWCNRLVQLPDSMGSLPNSSLQELYCAYNKLQRLPENIGNIKTLQVLGVGNNQLLALPDSLTRLRNLATLHCQQNKLPCLPVDMGALKQLRSLFLQDNHLTMFPPSFVELSLMQELDCSNNPIDPKNLGFVVANLHNLILVKCFRGTIFQGANLKQQWLESTGIGSNTTTSTVATTRPERRMSNQVQQQDWLESSTIVRNSSYDPDDPRLLELEFLRFGCQDETEQAHINLLQPQPVGDISTFAEIPQPEVPLYEAPLADAMVVIYPESLKETVVPFHAAPLDDPEFDIYPESLKETEVPRYEAPLDDPEFDVYPESLRETAPSPPHNITEKDSSHSCVNIFQEDQTRSTEPSAPTSDVDAGRLELLASLRHLQVLVANVEDTPNAGRTHRDYYDQDSISLTSDGEESEKNSGVNINQFDDGATPGVEGIEPPGASTSVKTIQSSVVDEDQFESDDGQNRAVGLLGFTSMAPTQASDAIVLDISVAMNASHQVVNSNQQTVREGNDQMSLPIDLPAVAIQAGLEMSTVAGSSMEVASRKDFVNGAVSTLNSASTDSEYPSRKLEPGGFEAENDADLLYSTNACPGLQAFEHNVQSVHVAATEAGPDEGKSQAYEDGISGTDSGPTVFEHNVPSVHMAATEVGPDTGKYHANEDGLHGMYSAPNSQAACAKSEIALTGGSGKKGGILPTIEPETSSYLSNGQGVAMEKAATMVCQERTKLEPDVDYPSIVPMPDKFACDSHEQRDSAVEALNMLLRQLTTEVMSITKQSDWLKSKEAAGASRDERNLEAAASKLMDQGRLVQYLALEMASMAKQFEMHSGKTSKGLMTQKTSSRHVSLRTSTSDADAEEPTKDVDDEADQETPPQANRNDAKLPRARGQDPPASFELWHQDPFF
jgi:Leucine-rich repeat (LRR) protein